MFKVLRSHTHVSDQEGSRGKDRDQRIEFRIVHPIYEKPERMMRKKMYKIEKSLFDFLFERENLNHNRSSIVVCMGILWEKGFQFECEEVS